MQVPRLLVRTLIDRDLDNGYAKGHPWIGGWGSVLCLIETSKHVLSLPLRDIMHHASGLSVGESFDTPSSLVRHNSVSDHASDMVRFPDTPNRPYQNFIQDRSN
jgi:hypothetical protein